MLHENFDTAHHLMSSLFWKNNLKILKNPLLFCPDGWLTDKTYGAEVQAVVEKQYLPKVSVQIQHIAMFYHSVAKPDRDVLKFNCQFEAWSCAQVADSKADSNASESGSLTSQEVILHGGFNLKKCIEHFNSATWPLELSNIAKKARTFQHELTELSGMGRHQHLMTQGRQPFNFPNPKCWAKGQTKGCT